MANKKKKITSFGQLDNFQQHKKPELPQKQPAVSSVLDDFELWLTGNWKKAIIGASVIAIVLIAGIIIYEAVKSADLAAQRELANGNDIETIQAALAKHPSNKAADAARLDLAGHFVEAKEYAKAREQLLIVASSANAQPFIKARAAIDAAYLLEQLGKKEEASAEFERIASIQQTPDDLRAEAAYSAARLFSALNQAMKVDAVLKNINMTAAESQGSSTVYGYWASRAKQLSDSLQAAAPAAPAAAPAA